VRGYTDEECFENILTVWTHYGRPPMYKEMRLPPSRVGPKAYLRWGTWLKALEAFCRTCEPRRGTCRQLLFPKSLRQRLRPFSPSVRLVISLWVFDTRLSYEMAVSAGYVAGDRLLLQSTSII